MLSRLRQYITHRLGRSAHHPQAPQGTDSHPALFRGASIARVHEEQRKWMSYYQPLDLINVEMIRECLSECTRGAYARQQWLWEQLEPVDSYMSVCVQRREAALRKYQWSIEPKPGLDDADQALAEAQARTVTDLCTAIVDMDDAIVSLGQASLRHYKFLQPYEESDGLHLLPVDNWLICRDGYRGAWRYNPSAQLGMSRGEELPIPLEGLIHRICPLPLDLPAQMLVLNRKTTTAQWDVFLGKYGVPPTYFILPEGIDGPLREAYIHAANNCISSAAGVLEHGSDIKSPTVPATSVELFDRRLSRANEEMVMIYTGGKLTMQAEAGSGTLAGNAHQDTWDEIMAGEAEDIATTLTDQLVGQVLDQYHAGQPRLVELVLTQESQTDTSQEVTNAAQLRASGYDLDLDQVRSRTGWAVSKGVNPPSIYESNAAGYVPTQGAIQQLMGMPMQPAPVDDGLTRPLSHSAPQTPYSLHCRRQSLLRTLAIHRRSTTWEPARQVLQQTIRHRLESIDYQLDSLSGDEDLLRRVTSLLTLPTMADIQAQAARIAPRVQRAVEDGKRRASTILSQQP